MNDTGWDKLVDAIDARFGIVDHGRNEEPLEDNQDFKQQIAFITFKKDGELFKMERVTSPAVLDRKSHFHKAAGSAVRFENIYDPENVVHKTNLYRQEGEGWERLDIADLSL